MAPDPVKLTIKANGPTANHVSLRINDEEIGFVVSELRLDLSAGAENVCVLKLNPDELDIDIPAFTGYLPTKEAVEAPELKVEQVPVIAPPCECGHRFDHHDHAQLEAPCHRCGCRRYHPAKEEP